MNHWGRTESTYTKGVALPVADSILCECHLPQYIRLNNKKGHVLENAVCCRNDPPFLSVESVLPQWNDESFSVR